MSANSQKLVDLLRRASTKLADRVLAAELEVRAERIDRFLREEKERCADGHRMGCGCVVLAAIDEPSGP